MGSLELAMDSSVKKSVMVDTGRFKVRKYRETSYAENEGHQVRYENA